MSNGLLQLAYVCLICGRTRIDSIAMEPFDCNDFRPSTIFQVCVLAGSCTKVRRNKLALVQQDLGGCLLVVVLQDDSAGSQFLNFRSLQEVLTCSWRPGCISCSWIHGQLGPGELLVFVHLWPVPWASFHLPLLPCTSTESGVICARVVQSKLFGGGIHHCQENIS